MHSPWVFGLIIVSGLGGIVISFLAFLVLVWATKSSLKEIMWNREWFYTGFLTGVFERLFFTSAIGLLGASGSGVMTAMVAWIAAKGQVHYRMFSEAGRKDISQIYLGLLGSMASLLVAILGGYLWDAKYTLAPYWPF